MTINSQNRPPVSNGNEDFIFISYAHHDCETVYADLWKFHDSGVRFWYDDGLPAGPDWDAIVEDRIRSVHCKAVLFYVSPRVFLSASLEKEIMLVYQPEDDVSKQRASNSFAVHLSGKSTTQMLLDAMNVDNNLSTTRIALITTRFGDKSTYIGRSEFPNNFDHIDAVLDNIIRLGLISSESERVISAKKVVQKIILICKKSIFSNALAQGINHYFAQKYNISLVTKFIAKDLSQEDAENQLNQIIDENKTEFSSFILRPTERVSDQTFELLQELTKLNKHVLLLDINLSNDQSKSIIGALPVYVGSDFSKGGVLLANRINEIVNILGRKYCQIVLFEGPNAKESVRERCASLRSAIEKAGNDLICLSVALSSFSEIAAAEKFREKITAWNACGNTDITEENLILFLGNDNVAKEIIRIYLSRDPSDVIYCFLRNARKIIFVGYDGLKDGNDEYVLNNYGLNYITVDAAPYQQGLIAGEKMDELLFANVLTKNQIIRVAPILVESVKLPIPKHKSVRELDYLLKGKKLFLFDLDGTIANTEKFHWKAYNELLKAQSIHLDDAHIAKYIGNAEVNIYDMLRTDFNAVIDTKKFLEERIKIYLALVREEKLAPYDYFRDIIEVYRDVPMALLTSQVPDVVNTLLTHWGLDKYFPPEFRITAHDNKITKRQVLENIGHFFSVKGVPVRQNEVILFEDADHVLEFAQHSKIKCIGIEHHYNEGRLLHADAVITTTSVLGLFLGLTGQDVVHYYDNELPAEDKKIKTHEFDTRIGGPAANAAIAYALLGGKAILVTYIGSSSAGKHIKNELAECGLIVIDLADATMRTPNISSVLINKHSGKRTIISGQQQVTEANLSAVLKVIDRVDFCLSDCNLGDTAVRVLQLFHERKKPVVLDAGSWKDNMDQCLSLATEVISSASFGKDNRDILQLADDYGLEFVAKTQGNMDILFKDGTIVGTVTPPTPELIVDTLGAGDIFHGAYCYSRFQLKAERVESLKYAAKIASMSVEKKGVEKRAAINRGSSEPEVFKLVVA